MIYFISFLLALIVVLSAWVFKLMVEKEILDEENTDLLRRIVKLEAEAHIRRLEEERRISVRNSALRLADSLKKVKDSI